MTYSQTTKWIGDIREVIDEIPTLTYVENDEEFTKWLNDLQEEQK